MPRKRPVKNRSKTGQKRDPQGRFLPGTVAGPGRPANPYARRLAALKVAFAEAVSVEDVQAIAGKLTRLATLGDVAAIKLFLAALIGPVAPIDPDQLDRHELEIRKHSPTELDRLMLIAQGHDEPDILTTEDTEADVNEAVEEDGTAEQDPMPEGQERNTAAAGWELFAETRLEMDEESACQLDFLWSKYTYWCADRAFPLLTEAAICTWLSERGVAIKTSPYGLPGTVRGIRVTE
jgi:hypothetical protein